MNIVLTIISTLIAISLSDNDDFGFESYFVRKQNLDIETNKFKLYWNILNDTHIEFGVICHNLGWCGLGISPNGGMPNSDFMIFWVKDDIAYIEDRHLMGANDNGKPILDNQQNLYLTYGAEINGYTAIKFIRSIVSCDTTHDNTINKGTTRFLYAFNPNDITKGDDTTFIYHTQRRSQSVNIFSNQLPDLSNSDPDIKVYNGVRVNMIIPPGDTSYCDFFWELPAPTTKHHIIKWAPHVFDGNAEYVHHLVMYLCKNIDMADFTRPKDTCTRDYGSDCEAIIMAWAIGGGDQIMPEEAGLPFLDDPNDINSIKYIRIEFHYDNPKGLTNILDQSGIDIYYTPNLRANDAGVIEMGISVGPTQFVPIGIPNALNIGYCTHMCTQHLTDDLTVFAGGLHTHTIGKSMIMKQIRNGVEMEPIMSNPSYDFDYQEVTYFNKDDRRIIKPNDTLIVECTYDSTQRNFMTYGGESTREEMCLAFVLVYPVPKFSLCISIPYHNPQIYPESPEQRWINEATQNNYFYNDRLNMSNPDALPFYNKFWTDTLYEFGPVYDYCLGNGFEQWNPDIQLSNILSYTPYTTIDPVCSNSSLNDMISTPINNDSTSEPTMNPTKIPTTTVSVDMSNSYNILPFMLISILVYLLS